MYAQGYAQSQIYGLDDQLLACTSKGRNAR